ncbi:hypothetical protein ACIQ1D_19425 [Lysinibacillus xylanilyticus]|uniref:hypothetical protein n=1 Tax=Lysinibacillus xylanilyticus TaxID=582475 RepID=UPI003812FC92
MATSFEIVYDRFLANITDYKLAKLDDVTLEGNLELWLKQAISFYPNPRKDLNNLDMKLKCFNEELNHTEIEVLSKFMIMSYMNTHIMREDLLNQSLNSKDYKIYSPANQLKALRELKESIKDEANTLISRNSYNVSSIKEMLK